MPLKGHTGMIANIKKSPQNGITRRRRTSLLSAPTFTVYHNKGRFVNTFSKTHVNFCVFNKNFLCISADLPIDF